MTLVTLIILSAVIACGTVVLALHWPMLAVCLFLGATLTNTPAILVHEHGLPSIGTLLVPTLTALLAVRTLLRREKPVTALRLLPLMGLFFVVIALRIPWVTNTEAAISVASELAKNLVIFLVLVGFLTTPERLRMAARTMSMTIGGVAALSVYQYATGRFDINFWGYANAAYLHIQGETHGWRLTGPLPDANFFAQLLLTTLPIPIALMISDQRWAMRAIAAICAVVILVSIVLTNSRGALLGLVVVAFATLLLSHRRTFILPGFLVGMALVALVGPIATFERAFAGIETARLLLGDADITGDPAVIQRVSVMRAALRMFADNPFLGVGPGQFATHYEVYALRYALDMTAPPAAHSLYLEIAAEQGLVGLILFMGFVLTALTLAARTLRHGHQDHAAPDTYLLRAIMLSVIGYLATSIFLHDAYPRFFWAFMALFIATLAVTAAASDKRTPLSRSSDMPEHSQEKAVSPAIRQPHTLQSAAAAALRKSMVLILLGAIAFGGLATYQTLQTPVQYSTDSKLLYRFGREYFPITPTEVRRNWGENITVSLDNALATELQLLSSHKVAEMTLDKLENPSLALEQTASEAEMTDAERVTAFSKLLDIRRVQGTTMLGVRLTYPDPKMADQLLQTFLESYMQRRDMLFHVDASAYFSSQQESLKAKDEAVQAELNRLRVERSAVESQADVTEWTLTPRLDHIPVDMAQITRQLLWLDGLIDQQEKRSEVFRTRLIALEAERQDWEMSRAYTQLVGPTVEIADRTPAARVSTSTRSIAQILSAAIAGAILIWGVFAAHLWLRGAREEILFRRARAEANRKPDA